MVSTMTVAARQQLNAAVDELSFTSEQLEQLFAVSDALAEQPSLRRALSDPGIESEARAELARRLLADRLAEPVVLVVAAAAGESWPDDLQFAAAVLDQAVRALLKSSPDAPDIARELFAFGHLTKSNPQLHEMLRDERASLSERRDLVAKLLDGKARPQTIWLAKYSISRSRGRGTSVPAMVHHFLDVGAQAFGRTLAAAATAQPMSETQHAELKRQLERIYQTEIFLVTEVDPELLGGVRVTVGDELIDGTVRARLDQVHQELRMGN